MDIQLLLELLRFDHSNSKGTQQACFEELAPLLDELERDYAEVAPIIDELRVTPF